MTWQMMMALLHSNEQLRTDRCGDTEKGCQKPVVQQKTTDDDDDDDDRYRPGKMSSRKISGKWASAGTRLKRLRRTGGAGGIVSPNASLTRDESGTF